MPARVILGFLALALGACSTASSKGRVEKFERTVPLSSYQRIELAAKNKKMRVYLADDSDKRREGLMQAGKNDLGPEEGMLFVFPTDGYLSFWMKNTPLPLDIAFLRADGTVINILAMKPYDLSNYSSAEPARYALETHAGWFLRNDIEPGDRFDLSLPAAGR
ncbi:MAG: DUF192 domain-containing protein [Elusimicrobia bacterium]|nr:DUF192 domain-containing protein [Elusimicrobiota bacterium]